MTTGFMRCGLMASGAIACVAMAAPAAAQTRSFDVPAQEATNGIAALGRQADIQIMAARKVTRNKRTRAVRGEMTVDQALSTLLNGSGLVARRTGAGTYIVVPLGEVRNDTAAAVAPSASAGTVSSLGVDEASEIIVTAQKREERLIDTPQSISVLSSQALERLGATQLRDFADTVPGLVFQTSGAGQNQVAMRGVTVGFDISPTIGVVVDDVPYGSSTSYAQASSIALDVGLFDIDRIEVLRGPQGTLYGASTMGGLIKYVSRLPNSDALGGEVRLGISDTRHGGISYNGSVVLNAPIAQDKAAVRVSGYYTRDGGYIDNVGLGQKDVNRARIYGGRIDLLLIPTERLSMRLGGFAQNISRDGSAMADYTLGGQPIDGRLDQMRLLEEPFEQRFRLVSATINYDLDFADLTSISSYQTLFTDYLLDRSRVFVPVFTSLGYSYSAAGPVVVADTKKFTEELRFASPSGRTFEWLVGGFYTHEKSTSDQYFETRNLAGQPVSNTLFTYFAPTTYEEIAVFGDVTYHFSPAFDVTGGVRYARNNQIFEQFGSGLLGSSAPRRASKDDVFTYLANARYHFSQDVTAYVRFATGYRPGGPNAIINDPLTGEPAGPLTFESDRLKSYEVGFKAQTPDGTFGIDLAGYYIDWNNIQLLGTRNGFSVKTNASGATSRGAELTLTARPTRGLIFTGAFAYQDAHLSEDAPDLRGVKGERLPNVPDFTAALTGDYQFEAGSVEPSFGGTLRFISDRTGSFNAATSQPQYRFPSYVTVDLRGGLEFGKVRTQLYVHNLFDTRGQVSSYLFAASRAGAGAAPIAITQPRSIGLSLTAQY